MTGAVTRRMLSHVLVPPLHHELVFFTHTGEAYELGNDAPVWVRAGTLEAVELTPAMRSRMEWRNSRTKAISLVDPLGTAVRVQGEVVAPQNAAHDEAAVPREPPQIVAPANDAVEPNVDPFARNEVENPLNIMVNRGCAIELQATHFRQDGANPMQNAEDAAVPVGLVARL